MSDLSQTAQEKSEDTIPNEVKDTNYMASPMATANAIVRPGRSDWACHC
jgi:hypothetical protein